MKYIIFSPSGERTYCEDGVACHIICKNNHEEWAIYKNNMWIYHRENGPAFILGDDENQFYYKCKIYSKRFYYFYYGELLNCKTQEEFKKLLKLKSFW